MKNFITDDGELSSIFNKNLNPNVNPATTSTGSQKKVYWNCEKCHNVYIREVRKIKEGFRCPHCYGSTKNYNRFSLIHKKLLNEWDYNKNQKNGITPDNITKGYSKEIYWRCSLKHSWKALIGNRLDGQNCPYCNNKRVLTGLNDAKTIMLKNNQNTLIKEWNDSNISSESIIFNSGKKVHWKCSTCSFEWRASITSRINKNIGCPKCAKYKLGVLIQKNSLIKNGSLKDLKPELEKEYSKNNKIPFENIPLNLGVMYLWNCLKCNKIYKCSGRKKTITSNCPDCNGQSSKIERELQQYIKSIYNGKVMVNDRKIIAPYELDVYLPELNIAIEFNGDYWHSDEVIYINKGVSSRENNINKLALAYEKNIDLFFVWESDWKNNNIIIKRALKSLLYENIKSPIIRRLANE